MDDGFLEAQILPKLGNFGYVPEFPEFST